MTHALITGASSGLGVEFAQLFARRKIPLILSASPRSKAILEAQAAQLRDAHGIDVRVHVCDLSEAQAADELADWVQQQGLVVEYLVNNAGFGICGQHFQDYDPDMLQRMLMVNINSLSRLTSRFIQTMCNLGRGRILNVSSIAGFIYPHGLEAAYAASKAYVVSLSEGLADDLRGTGVTCTHLAPGPTRTKFFATAGLKSDARIRKLGLYMEPDEVAELGFRAMMAGKARCIPGMGNRAMVNLARFSPSRTLVARISGAVLEG